MKKTTPRALSISASIPRIQPGGRHLQVPVEFQTDMKPRESALREQNGERGRAKSRETAGGDVLREVEIRDLRDGKKDKWESTLSVIVSLIL